MSDNTIICTFKTDLRGDEVQEDKHTKSTVIFTPYLSKLLKDDDWIANGFYVKTKDN